jgi:hypothetical protein
LPAETIISSNGGYLYIYYLFYAVPINNVEITINIVAALSDINPENTDNIPNIATKGLKL